jgi:anti-sigma factor RsiW
MREQEFQCGDVEALVTFLYGECDARERGAIEAHLLACVSCAEEVETLRGTRTLLGAWTPPVADLGFQITRVHDAQPDDVPAARVLRPARWWSRPLPAWAQVAAAAAIFAAGVGIGASRRGPETQPTAAAQTALVQRPIAATSSAAPTVSPADLERVEARLRGEIAQQLRTVSAVAPVPRTNNDEVMRQVKAMIADSERRQQQTSAVRIAQTVGQLEEQRRVDIAQMQRAVGDVQRIAGATYQDQNRLVRLLVNSQQR